MLRRHVKWHLGGHWTVHLEAHPGSTRKDESRWNTLRGTVEMNLFDIDHCWQFIIDMTKTYVFAHTEKFAWYKDILSSSASLSLVLVFYTSSGMLLTSVTEHLIWKYIRVVESKIKFINIPQSSSGNGGVVSWIVNHCSHHWRLVRSDTQCLHTHTRWLGTCM